MNELIVPEEANKEKMNKEDFKVYNQRVMSQEEITSYKDVVETEEVHEIQRQDTNKEILIIRKPSKHPLDPVAEDHIMGDNQS
jgi:hypothetical protein